MASLSTQFFATLDELVDLASGWLGIEGLHAVAVEDFPFAVVPTAREDVEEQVRRPRVARLVFAERPIACSAQTGLQLRDRNEGVLILDLGRLGPAWLAERALKPPR